MDKTLDLGNGYSLRLNHLGDSHYHGVLFGTDDPTHLGGFTLYGVDLGTGGVLTLVAKAVRLSND